MGAFESFNKQSSQEKLVDATDLDFTKDKLEMDLSNPESWDDDVLEKRAKEITAKRADTASDNIPSDEQNILDEWIRRLNARGIGGNFEN